MSGVPDCGFRALAPAHRIAAGQDAVDQRCHGLVQFGIAVALVRVLMRRSGVLQDAQDLALGKDVTVVERQQERFADCERGGT